MPKNFKNRITPLKWEPAAPKIKKDTLIGAPSFRYLKPFVPSFEKKEEENMFLLLGWEYGRMWFEEHAKWEIEMYEKRDKGKLIKYPKRFTADRLRKLKMTKKRIKKAKELAKKSIIS